MVPESASVVCKEPIFERREKHGEAGKAKCEGDAEKPGRDFSRAWRGVISYAYKRKFFNELHTKSF